MQYRFEKSSALTGLEAVCYAVLAVIVAIGFYLALTDETFFRDVYVREDGVLESGTAILFFITGMICLTRMWRGRGAFPRAFFVTNGIIAALMVFGAGEEISWGQRIFGIETTEFFAENNRQYETNLHNLTFYGINLNKLIFGKMLTIFLVLFYLVLPVLYAKKNSVARFFDRKFIPVPKLHLGLFMLAIALVINMVPSSKKGELNEICLGVFFLLTILLPQTRFFPIGRTPAA